MVTAPLAKARSADDPYDRDFYEWTVAQARALRSKQAAALDWENVAEEIESLGKTDKRSIESNLNVLIRHLLKWRFQPSQRSSGWRGTIMEHRSRISRVIADSPSLRPYPASVFSEEYGSARLKAVDDTGLSESDIPESPPFTIEEVLDPDFLPEAPRP